MPSIEAIPGWNSLAEAIASARRELAAAALDGESAAEADAYLMRVITSGLADSFLSHVLTTDGLLRAMPTRGAPNPDYLLSHMLIDPKKDYRVEGCLHASERVGIGLYSIGANGPARCTSYSYFTRRDLKKDGTFELNITPDGAMPGSLRMTPNDRLLLVRILHRNSLSRPAKVVINGAIPIPKLGIPQGTVERSLNIIAYASLHSIRQFIHWSRLNVDKPNCFSSPPAPMIEEIQSDPNTHYSLGRFDLKENQWLEVEIPRGKREYWSLHAYNHWCEYLPGAGVHDLSAVADKDKGIRVAVGPQLDANLANRIDTQGRRRGILIFRTLNASRHPLPVATLRSRKA